MSSAEFEAEHSSLVTRAGKLCGLMKSMFTWALCVGIDAEGYERRYCYEHEADAHAALEAWDGTGHPGGPWIKVKGAGIDMLNPEMEKA